jgi:hypothetical protein
LIDSVVAEYADLPQVEAIALGGSQTTEVSDEISDIDLYVYLNADLPVEDRREIAKKFDHHPEVGNSFWEHGDEWIDSASGTPLDVMFRTIGWIEEQLARILEKHEASVGYSTCFWHNVLSSQILFDRNDWFTKLQQKTKQPYPHALRQAIIAKNFPILRNTRSSYLNQIKRAIKRGDSVSIQHRTTAFLASYFDVLFAINGIPHPGEKRLIEFVENHCGTKPLQMRAQIEALLNASIKEKPQTVNALIDGLEKLLS